MFVLLTHLVCDLCLNHARPSFHFIVTGEVSASSIPPPGFFAEQTPVSKVMDLPGRWLAWCGGRFTSRCQGEPPDGPERPCHCRPPLAVCVCAVVQTCFYQSNLGLGLPDPKLSNGRRRRRRGVTENKWACFTATFGLWAVKKLLQQVWDLF